MRVLICGDRNWNRHVDMVAGLVTIIPVDKYDEVTIVHGGCRGADLIAAGVAANMGWKVEEHKAKWHQYGRAAGPRRNCEMLATGIDLVIACHSDLANSKGTKDMVERALKAGVEVEYIT